MDKNRFRTVKEWIGSNQGTSAYRNLLINIDDISSIFGDNFSYTITMKNGTQHYIDKDSGDKILWELDTSD